MEHYPKCAGTVLVKFCFSRPVGNCTWSTQREGTDLKGQDRHSHSDNLDVRGKEDDISCWNCLSCAAIKITSVVSCFASVPSLHTLSPCMHCRHFSITVKPAEMYLIQLFFFKRSFASWISVYYEVGRGTKPLLGKASGNLIPPQQLFYIGEVQSLYVSWNDIWISLCVHIIGSRWEKMHWHARWNESANPSSVLCCSLNPSRK